MEQVNAFQQANKSRFLDELIELLKIPSISADPAYKSDVFRTAEFVMQSLEHFSIHFCF